MASRPTILPPQGTPGISDPRNPTLIPNFDRNSIKGDANSVPSVNHSSPAGYLADSPRTAAQATATFGGSVTTGDILTLEVVNPTFPGGLLSHTYTTIGGDTVSTIADAFANLFNDDPIAAQHDLTVDAAAAVLTFSHNGPVGNFSTLVAPTEEGSKVTIAGTALTGDQVSILFASPNLPGGAVLITRAVTTGDTPTVTAAALVASITANAALAAASITAANVAGVINMTVPAAAEPLTISSWVNTAAPTAAITGSVAAGDIVNLIFTGAGVAGSPVTVSYTALLADTTTSVAVGLAAAINANAALSSAGISATNTTNTVNVFGFGGNTNGQLRLTSSVSPGSETVTISTTPTTTAVTATLATETITFSPVGGGLVGGDGPVFATNNFEFAPAAGGISYFLYGQPYNVGYDVLTQMAQQGMPIV